MEMPLQVEVGDVYGRRVVEDVVDVQTPKEQFPIENARVKW